MVDCRNRNGSQGTVLRILSRDRIGCDFRNHDDGGCVGLAGWAVYDPAASTPNRQTDRPTMVKNCCNLGASVTWMGTPPAVSAPLPIAVHPTRPAHLMNTYTYLIARPARFRSFVDYPRDAIICITITWRII
jgi:hypothetical protein